MIQRLFGNSGTAAAVQSSIGKKLKSIKLNGDNVVCAFDDGAWLRLWDNGQSCCESRYVTSDDNDKDFAGHTLVNVEIREAAKHDVNEYTEHEIQFLAVKTDKDEFVATTHNEHNGYYGGFSINAEYGPPAA